MRSFKIHVFITFGLLCFVLFILFQTFALGHTARLVPEKVALFCLPLLLFQVITDIFPAIEKRAGSDRTMGLERKDISSLNEDRPDDLIGNGSYPAGRSEYAVFWVLVIPVLVFIFGLNPAVFIYSLIYIKFRGSTGWLRSAMIAGILGAAVYLIFEHALGISLYRGQLLRWLGA
jgi:hypothetical protein